MNNPMIGTRFGRLTIFENRSKDLLCKCDCGVEKLIKRVGIIKGTTRSCGCLHKETIATLKRTHGASGTLTWNRWRAMIARCTMRNAKSYPRYGGRGIQVCENWIKSFPNFISDMGECPSAGWTIERINNDGNYEPLNCKWETKSNQNKNTSRTHFIEYLGKKLCISDWSIELNIPRTSITAWLKSGMNMDGIVAKSNGIKASRNEKC